MKDVVLGAKYFNFIALAALTAKLTIIDGTLLQEAFGQEVRADPAAAVNVTGYANTTIPNTGRVSGRAAQPGLLAKNFNDNLKIWSQGGGLLPNGYQDCDGLCYLNVPGGGFGFDCNEPQTLSIDNGNTTQTAFCALKSNIDCQLDDQRDLSCTTGESQCTALLPWVRSDISGWQYSRHQRR